MLPAKLFSKALCLVALCAVLAACEEEKIVPEPPIRAIKTIVVSERAGTQIRRIAGLTESSIVTDLAFQVGGRIVSMDIEVGDRVEKGAVIAALDAEPFKLRIQTNDGHVADARAKLKDYEAKYKQQATLFDQGFATKTAFDSAISSFNSAKSAVNVALAEQALAKRDMRQTTLTSPMSGNVTSKYVERYSEISTGQKIVQVSADGGLKVNTSVPEGLIRRLSVGDAVQITFPTLEGRLEPGKISEVGTRAGSTNSFPVIVVLDNPATDLLPGLTAEIEFEYKTLATGKAFLLPVTAVLATAPNVGGTVFVFDEAASVVRQKKVQVVNVHNNELEVTGDIAKGDVVAVAGVSFLVDGMKVKLLTSGQAE